MTTEVERLVLELKHGHRHTWRRKSGLYWLLKLLEEVVELSLALVGLHKHTPEHELAQIATIAMNWLELREG